MISIENAWALQILMVVIYLSMCIYLHIRKQYDAVVFWARVGGFIFFLGSIALWSNV